MYVHRLASSVVVRAPAKLNLFFEVLARRGDGYHEIESLMVPIGLFDTLTARAGRSGEVRLSCHWETPPTQASAGDDSLGVLPAERDNLAWRAANLLRERAGVTQGISLDLAKRIPSAAGLGGGSSDAAAALVAANAVWNLGWSRSDLAQLAAELGSDVPFFLYGGAALCRGRGERITPVSGLMPLHVVVARPPAGLSTAAVYARCKPAPEPRGAEPLVAALRAGDTRDLKRLVFNRLQEAAAELSPWVERLENQWVGEDCLADQMSGSGTSYFGICRHARHARRVAARLQARGVGRVYATTACN